jgi:hypothetical protein
MEGRRAQPKNNNKFFFINFNHFSPQAALKKKKPFRSLPELVLSEAGEEHDVSVNLVIRVMSHFLWTLISQSDNARLLLPQTCV